MAERDTVKRFALTLLALGAVANVFAIACSPSYYERAVDPPGVSYGVGIVAKLQPYDQPSVAYMLGPALSGYARVNWFRRLSVSGQIDEESEWTVFRTESSLPFHYVSAELTGGAKIRTWKLGAVEVKGGLYAARVNNPLGYSTWCFHNLELSLLQDFAYRNPLTLLLSVGMNSAQIAIGAEMEISRNLLARVSAGATMPVGAIWNELEDVHLGFAIEPLSKRGD